MVHWHNQIFNLLVSRRYFCFGGGGNPIVQAVQAPAVTPAPTPAPLPSPTPTAVESTITAENRRKKIAAMRYGLLSTIKTSPQGITGTGANLYGTDAASKKTTLGS